MIKQPNKTNKVFQIIEKIGIIGAAVTGVYFMMSVFAFVGFLLLNSSVPFVLNLTAPAFLSSGILIGFGIVAVTGNIVKKFTKTKPVETIEMKDLTEKDKNEFLDVPTKLDAKSNSKTIMEQEQKQENQEKLF